MSASSDEHLRYPDHTNKVVYQPTLYGTVLRYELDRYELVWVRVNRQPVRGDNEISKRALSAFQDIIITIQHSV